MFTRRPNMLKAAHKLHYRTEFQGLPISIENRKGTYRHWYDPNKDEKGKTKMELPYGYVRSSLGVDGDAVDVFVGPNQQSQKVFIVKQMKAPEYKTFDENKIMLGFDDPKVAKKYYLRHYNDKRFFGDMKEVSMDEFKKLLKEKKGKPLTKALWEQ